jgi:acyl dehydratase
VWLRPFYWSPGETPGGQSLRTHYDLKEAFGLPEGIITKNALSFYAPVHPGDRLRTAQVLRSVSPVKTVKVGRGRFWVIDSIIENQQGELCAIDRYTGLGYTKAEDKQ